MATFNDRLREVLADNRLTEGAARAELRRRGLTRANLTHWFRGRTIRPTMETAAVAADFFNVNVEWFVTGKGSKHSTPELRGGKKVTKLLALSQDAVELAAQYDAMEPHVQALIRRHMRDLNEALGAPSAGNPFGKGPRRATSPKKASGPKRRVNGTQ